MPTVVNTGRVVSGKTKAKRTGGTAVTIDPRTSTTAAQNPATTTAPGTTGARVVSGKTVAARGTSNAGGGATITTTGDTTAAPATGAKSGATIAARNQAALIHNVIWGFGIAAVVVGSIYLIRHYKLLTGGR